MATAPHMGTLEELLLYRMNDVKELSAEKDRIMARLDDAMKQEKEIKNKLARLRLQEIFGKTIAFDVAGFIEVFQQQACWRAVETFDSHDKITTSGAECMRVECMRSECRTRAFSLSPVTVWHFCDDSHALCISLCSRCSPNAVDVLRAHPYWEANVNNAKLNMPFGRIALDRIPEWMYDLVAVIALPKAQ